MELLNNLNKTFIDILSYIPGAILKLLLGLLYLYFYNNDLFLKVLSIIEEHQLVVIIIFFGLLYFVDIIFSFLSYPFKIKKRELDDTEIKKIIKTNKELKKIYNYQNNNNRGFTSSLLDISNNIGYIVPMFFENKILLFKSLRNTLIVFYYINSLFIIYNIIYFNKLNLIIGIILSFIYILFIFILKKEIIEYYSGFISSLLNINFYLKNNNKNRLK